MHGEEGEGGGDSWAPPSVFRPPPPPLHPDLAWLCRCCFLPWGRSPAKVMGPTGDKTLLFGEGGGWGEAHTLNVN